MVVERPLPQSGHPVAAFLFALFLGFLRILPWCFFRALSHGLLVTFFFISPRLRKNAIESLSIAFGDTLSPTERKDLAYRSFVSLSSGIAAFIYAIEHPQVTARYFVWEGREHLDQALAQGKGAVVAVAHFGPFVWMIQHMANEGYKTNVVMRAPRGEFFKKKFPEARPRLGLNLIYSVPVRGCVVESMKALERGEVVFMPIDQNYGGNGRVFVDFFGRQAATAPGVIGYGLKTGAPILFAYCLPLADGRFKIVIDAPLDMFGEVDEKAVLVRKTAVLTARLEALIRQHPDQWSWMHRRWKAVPRDGEI